LGIAVAPANIDVS
jgi:hypothetical protein